MTKITITEALAEIPLALKKINKKSEFIQSYLLRQASQRDPHEAQGGSFQLVANEIAAIDGLFEYIIKLRTAISSANDKNSITIGNKTRTISEWLVWRRDVAPIKVSLLKSRLDQISATRNQALRSGRSLVTSDPGVTNDIIVNVNEAELYAMAEELETQLGLLDGQLSLKNATIEIEL